MNQEIFEEIANVLESINEVMKEKIAELSDWPGNQRAIFTMAMLYIVDVEMQVKLECLLESLPEDLKRSFYEEASIFGNAIKQYGKKNFHEIKSVYEFVSNFTKGEKDV